jgi:beta-1,4-mannosyltransferase
LPDRALTALSDRWTSLWITLLAETPVPTGTPTVLIPHGHYCDWFIGHQVPDVVPGRLLCFGLLRRYKGVEVLLDAFHSMTGAEVTLHVVGQPRDDSIRQEVVAAAATDPRITGRLEYVTDAELAAAIGAADLVVLPYHEMHSSGALLLALSLGRRALVPNTPATRALADEVGPGWVVTYDGTLTAAVLAEALARPRPAGRPDLSARAWGPTAQAHLTAFRAARDAVGPHPWRARLMGFSGR